MRVVEPANSNARMRVAAQAYHQHRKARITKSKKKLPLMARADYRNFLKSPLQVVWVPEGRSISVYTSSFQIRHGRPRF